MKVGIVGICNYCCYDYYHYYYYYYVYYHYFTAVTGVLVQGMSLHWCMQPDIGLPQPDAVLFLSLDTDAAVHRDSYGNERYENVAFQGRVADVFRQLKRPYWKVRTVVHLFTYLTSNVSFCFVEFEFLHVI